MNDPRELRRQGLTQDEILHMLDHEMEIAGRNMSRAEAVCYRFKNIEDHIIGREMILAAAKGFEKVGEQTREAHASGAYLDWVEKSTQALEQREYYKHQYWTMKSKVDIFLSQQADERIRAKLHGGGG